MRPEIEALEQNGITRTALPHLGDPDIIPLWFGEGDQPTDARIRAAAAAALDAGMTFYGHTRGRPELRSAIADYLERLHGVRVADERIVVPGSSMLGVFMAAQMAFGRGDHVVLVSPHWPNVDRVVQVIGARFDCVRQRQGRDGWALDFDDLEQVLRQDTRAIYLNSPSNPTGWVASREELSRLLALCRERGIMLIADEVYHRTVYDGEVAPSLLDIAEAHDPVVIVNGFSKAFAMTGWRMGWLVAPAGYGEQLAVMSECFNTSAPSFLQHAGVFALRDGQAVIERLREQYRRGRDIVMDHLGDHPDFELARPDGAFYAFPRIRGLRSSSAFVDALLAEEKVGLAPGDTFGPGNESHVRLCFAQSHTRLAEALDRLVRFVEREGDRFR